MQHTPVYSVSTAAREPRVRRRHKPLGVILIALYGFACAFLLSYGLWQSWQFNQFHPDFGQELLLSHFDEILVAVPVCIAIHVLVSVGLLLSRQAARVARIALSAVNLAIYLHSQSFFFQEVPSQIDLAGHTTPAILLADFVILLYLAFFPEASFAFRPRR